MNELDIQTLKIKPAEIEFNHEKIMEDLDKTLARYKNIVHTEETTNILRNDIANLRKGKKMINRYRIDRKNEMLIPITEFENKIKEIEKKFEEVEIPLVEQEKEFEAERRKSKLVEVEKIRQKVFDESGLEGEGMIADVIMIDNSYLTKTKTFTKIEEEMKDQAEDIKQSIEARKANEEIIKLTVQNVNATNNLNLSATPYLSQLEVYEVDQVKYVIEQDAKKEIEQIEKAKKEEEQAEFKRTEKEEMEKEFGSINTNEVAADDIEEVEVVEVEHYMISFEATKEQFDLLLKFAKANGINIDTLMWFYYIKT